MTDEKKKNKLPDELGDADWDKALSEWDENSFVPEVAKDVVTDKPAAKPQASKPLYRPPTVTPATPRAGAPGAAPTPSKTAVQSKAPPPQKAPPPPRLPRLDEDGDGPTVITTLPRELLSRLPRRSSAPPPPTTRRPEPLVDELPEGVVTSAAGVGGPTEGSGAEPLRRPSLAEATDIVGDGGMFDPFAESKPEADPFAPPQRPELITLNAEEDLLSEAARLSRGESAPDDDDVDEETPVLPESVRPGPALHAPRQRQYGSEEDTAVTSDATIAKMVQAATRPSVMPRRADDETSASGVRPVATSGELPPPMERVWPDEKPSVDWLDEGARAALHDRATWLEEEARALADNVGRARGLLVCSEILATIGDPERALGLADEARATAPSVALAHRQARALAAAPHDARAQVAALDTEIKMTAAGPARIHSMLLASDTLRANGDAAEASQRLDQIARLASSDVRAAVTRAALALGRNETAGPALKIADGAELAPVAEALGACLRLRSAGAGPAAKGASSPGSPSEVVMRARAALSKGDVAGAADLVAQLDQAPELADGARWLAAALGATRRERRADAVEWLKALADRGDAEASRARATRAFELEARGALAEELARAAPLTAMDRVTLATLAGVTLSPSAEDLDAAAIAEGMAPLACAATALAMPGEGGERAAQVRARAERTAGTPESRAGTGLGRLLAAASAPADVQAALESLGSARSPVARGVALEFAARAGRTSEVSETLAAWGARRETADDRAVGALAAAVVAEWGGDKAAAIAAFRAARSADATCEAAVRALASLEQLDVVAEINELADGLGEGVRGAFARIEAVALGDATLPDPTKAQLLEGAHKAAPQLPIAAYLAERIARRAGDAEEALRWVRERRAHAADPAEIALDSVREALFVAENEPALAEERLREAHEARPTDVALRELYERVAAQPPADRAQWREQRAAEATGDARILVYLDAAGEYERTGDEESALRCAEAAAGTEAPLGRIARERAELRAGRVARLSDELITQAKGVDDPRTRREAFERLASLDATVGNDPASALLWHRSILEEQPGYKPSLRHVEQHLVGEGRDEELEPVLTGIAMTLRSTGSGESSAHAEAAARLRMRGAEGRWEATSDLVQMAAAEAESTLWALRMAQAHARARGDDEAVLGATLRLVERAPRPAERATLLVRAGEAAARLGRLQEACTHFLAATVDDPADVVAWTLLAGACRRAGDARGAAEACEALARTTGVEEHRLAALHEAARTWLDEAHDEGRGLAALEGAAAMDVTHADVFPRLSGLYASRKMQPELASLLERRIERVTDPQERLEIELRRGRVLLEVGDVPGARAAFQSALQEHPDDARALSAYTDFCLSQKEWEIAENSLVQLTRLLPGPDEQRGAYARLAELYSDHLLNLSRAEVALKEVLKRSPDDLETAAKLVRIYARQNDAARAVELQQELVTKSTTPDEKRARVIDLSALHEQVGKDNRRAEQVLESGRREFPQDVTLLRAMAEFYQRHRQTPAFNILLDRASADARRGLSAGRLVPSSFEILATAFDLRGRTDAARSTRAMLAALEARPAELLGAGAERALDPALDDLLAPEAMSPAMRSLLAKTGEVLDAVTPVDLRALQASPVPTDSPVARFVARAAAAAGIPNLNVLASPKLGTVCIPVGSSPPALILGGALVHDERLGPFLALRALKLVRIKGAALARTAPGELGVVVSAWLKCFSPSWQAQGINPAALNAALAKMQAVVPRNLPPDVGALALELASNIGTRQATLGPAALAWANRTALLALGDPNGALDAIAAATPAIGANALREAPRDAKDRGAWVAKTPEARDLIAFGVAEAFAEARSRLGLERA